MYFFLESQAQNKTRNKNNEKMKWDACYWQANGQI